MIFSVFQGQNYARLTRRKGLTAMAILICLAILPAGARAQNNSQPPANPNQQEAPPEER
jgi:hypothetical protein